MQHCFGHSSLLDLVARISTAAGFGDTVAHVGASPSLVQRGLMRGLLSRGWDVGRLDD